MLSEKDRRLLEKAAPTLIKHTDIHGSDVLDQLIKRKALRQKQVQIIKTEAGNDKQVTKLLEFLYMGGVAVVDKLIYSLRDAGLSDVADACLREPKRFDAWSSDEDEEEENLRGSPRAVKPVGSLPSVDVTVAIHSLKRKRSEETQSQENETTPEFDAKRRVVKDIELYLLKALRVHSEKISCSDVPLNEKKANLTFMKECHELRRQILDITESSIHIRVTVPTLEALEDLYQKCVSGLLKEAFCTEFITTEFLRIYHLESVDLSVEIEQPEYQQLRARLAGGGEDIMGRLETTDEADSQTDSEGGLPSPEKSGITSVHDISEVETLLRMKKRDPKLADNNCTAGGKPPGQDISASWTEQSLGSSDTRPQGHQGGSNEMTGTNQHSNETVCRTTEQVSKLNLKQGGRNDSVDPRNQLPTTDVEEDTVYDPPLESSAHCKKPEQMVDHRANVAISGSGAGVGELKPVSARLQTFHISDEEVPDYLRLSQIDLLVVHSAADKQDAQELLNQVCFNNDVTGDLFSTSMTETDEGVMHVSSQRPDTITKNIERATYVILYMTINFCKDAELRFTYFQSLQSSLLDESKRHCVFPVWVESKTNVEAFVNQSLKDVKGLKSLLVFNGINKNKDELETMSKLLKGRSAQCKKRERKRAQSQRIQKWKNQKADEALQMKIEKLHFSTQQDEAGVEKAPALETPHSPKVTTATSEATNTSNYTKSSTGKALYEPNPPQDLVYVEPSQEKLPDGPHSYPIPLLQNLIRTRESCNAKMAGCYPPPYHSLSFPASSGIPADKACSHQLPEATASIPTTKTRSAGGISLSSVEQVHINFQEHHHHTTFIQQGAVDVLAGSQKGGTTPWPGTQQPQQPPKGAEQPQCGKPRAPQMQLPSRQPIAQPPQHVLSDAKQHALPEEKQSSSAEFWDVGDG